MTVFSEGRYTAEFLVSEANGTLSRDVVTIVSGAGELAAGAVLGKVTASGKYTALAPAANDGSEAAAAILYERADATAADVKRTSVLRDAEVNGAELVWPTGITEPQKATAISQLAAHGILVR